MMQQVLFEDSKKVMVDLYTDSQSFLDSVVSSKQVEKKIMCPVIADMNERLVEGNI